MPTLIVLRHAKAVAGLGVVDFDRPLADRGRRDAAATGDWLRAEGLVPVLALCSTAVRTRQTLDLLDLKTEVSHEARLYDNEPEIVLDLVRQTGDDVGTLLVVGHNPSTHQVVHDLTGDAPESFPTCALAVIELTAPWAETWPGGGALTTFRTPKD
ncbi:SixA phosphatase family protein [Actinomadura hibisca]|uniref:SixA phosphatase family protein n=1 Tax=Actinomadura hibisca TaxID=68565 RepID=UPI000ADD85EA|nr:histidine phosphatase family protein [Actinomadura hibisca]